MKVQLNLSTAALENKRPFLVAASVLGGIGVITLLLYGHAAFSSWRSNRQLRGEIATWQSKVREYQQRQSTLQTYFQSPQAKEVLDRAKFLNGLIGERSFPWTKIFMDLEPTLPAGVRVVNIAPKWQDGSVLIDLTVGAGTDEQKLKFIEALEKSKAFSDIRLIDDHRTEEPGKDRIELKLSAVYSTI
jgi:Tfp pilus assembly protein PilN